MSSYRSYRGRGRGGGGGNNGPRGRGFRRDLSSHVPPPVSDEPFGPEIDKIKIPSLLIEEDAPTIENVNYLASYNWLDSKYPIILVPGSPPAWSPPSENVKLPVDSGSVYRDINAARYPEYPMEPAVRSILALEPKFNLQDVDLVACGSTIGNLLRFAGSLKKPFRFDADLSSSKVKSTIDEEFVKLGVGNAAFVSDKLKLDLRMQGVKRPQSQIFDLKTRRSLNIFEMEEVLPRLWYQMSRTKFSNGKGEMRLC
ncbi:hypothetical protein DID88_002089 [Monilinia fructigena]|uniref:Uncharacterized protein n=1 Tax=Monilinia fructigena TaxID=38457 RepID=A0A395IV66_9HELO|nr:hypothetical protein DID88_002089 [Monilinia fructigena]